MGSILGKTLSVILAGLKDSVDDVAAVAASALIPAAQTIVSDFPHQVTYSLLKVKTVVAGPYIPICLCLFFTVIHMPQVFWH